MTNEAGDYVIRVEQDPTKVDAAAWDALVDRQSHASPFVRHAYLSALHTSGSACPATGWTPHWLLVWRGQELCAGCPVYVKTHSFGEYVFDWSWAEAHERHGLAYYPKLVAAVPFTPVPGARLLAKDADARQVLLDGLSRAAALAGASSLHLLFEQDAQALDDEGSGLNASMWLWRQGVQFHWQAQDEWKDFDDFLRQLQRSKRKKIQQERRRVLDAGIRFRSLSGPELDEDAWAFFDRCYTQTYRDHRSSPYLTPAFFRQTHQSMPSLWRMFVASQGGEDVAASLIAVDARERVAYGRYWGALRPLRLVHFEACYYQPIEWCIQARIRRFEGGAQGEHKLARGFEPVSTQSAHWIVDERFRAAIKRFTEREGPSMEAYVDELQAHSAFRSRLLAHAGPESALRLDESAPPLD